MAASPDKNDLLEVLAAWREAPRWWLGLSGGLDSCVLLALLLEAREGATLPPLAAIHVNHQLHPDADQWQAHCEALCAAHGVPLEVRKVEIEEPGRAD